MEQESADFLGLSVNQNTEVRPFAHAKVSLHTGAERAEKLFLTGVIPCNTIYAIVCALLFIVQFYISCP